MAQGGVSRKVAAANAVKRHWPPLRDMEDLADAMTQVGCRRTLDHGATIQRRWPRLADTWSCLGPWLAERWYTNTKEGTSSPWTFTSVTLALRYVVLTLRHAHDVIAEEETTTGSRTCGNDNDDDDDKKVPLPLALN